MQVLSDQRNLFGIPSLLLKVSPVFFVCWFVGVTETALMFLRMLFWPSVYTAVGSFTHTRNYG